MGKYGGENVVYWISDGYGIDKWILWTEILEEIEGD